MKKLITIFLFLLLTGVLGATTYYIRPGGNNGNAGTSNTDGGAWKTLEYAGDHTTSGDIIHVSAGTYIETAACNLGVGVSIEGEGVSSYIINRTEFTRSGNLSGAAITLSSASQGTNGNQHITGIKLDGDNQVGVVDESSATGTAGILVKRRSNVKIYDCTITGFYLGGVFWHGGEAYGAYNDPPSVYATGNELYNCILTKNGDTDNTWAGGGQIEIGSQDGTLIHDNILNNTGRPLGHNGNNLSGVYHNKGIKFYNNISTKNDDEGAWNFHIEMWCTDGGFEVYNNEFWGGDTGIDIAGYWNVKGDYPYSWFVHDNLFTGTVYVSGYGKYCIDLENVLVEDVWIYRNHFKDRPSPVNVTNGTSPNAEIRRIYICYNIMENCGWQYPDLYHNIMNIYVAGDMVLEDVYVYNNDILGDIDMFTTAIKLDVNGTINNFNIKNNIIGHNYNSTWLNVVNNGTISGLYVDNNILFDNAGGDDPLWDGTTHTFNNNIKTDPLFVSTTNFHLTESSQAIGHGINDGNIGTTIDYDSVTVSNPPDIGALQYAAGSQGGQVTYYVKNSGNDSNTGLSDAEAWATVAKTNSATINPGDIVLFNRGDVWREQINPHPGSSGSKVIYGAYGSGAKPKFLGSVTANSGWTNISGNIWQNSNAAFTVDVGNLIFNDEESCGVKLMTASPTFTTQGQFWYDHVNHRIRMYSVSNPATFYSNIECALAYDGIYGNTSAHYIIFQDLDFRYWGYCVRQNGGNYCEYRNLDLSFIGGCDSGDMSDLWYDTRFGNGLQAWEGEHDITITGCRIDNCYDAGISPQGYAAGVTAYNLWVRNNVVSNCEYNLEFYHRQGTASNMYIEHNTFINGGGGFSHNQRPDVRGFSVRLASFTATKTNINIRNNIFYGATMELFYIDLPTDLDNIVLDYNLYYTTGSELVGYVSNTDDSYSTFLQWEAGMSQETHGVGANALFVDAANGDYHLQANSPAVGAGVAVTGVTADKDGVSWQASPSMGAYEFTGGVVTSIKYKKAGGSFITRGGKKVIVVQ